MKALVVEDNKRLGQFLKRALGEEGYVVDLVTDGDTALQQAGTIGYDVIVLDWMLPDTDGVTVCRTLRGRGCAVPIVMLTARSEISERITGLDAGADDYIVKPFDPRGVSSSGSCARASGDGLASIDDRSAHRGSPREARHTRGRTASAHAARVHASVVPRARCGTRRSSFGAHFQGLGDDVRSRLERGRGAREKST